MMFRLVVLFKRFKLVLQFNRLAIMVKFNNLSSKGLIVVNEEVVLIMAENFQGSTYYNNDVPSEGAYFYNNSAIGSTYPQYAEGPMKVYAHTLSYAFPPMFSPQPCFVTSPSHGFVPQRNLYYTSAFSLPKHGIYSTLSTPQIVAIIFLLFQNCTAPQGFSTPTQQFASVVLSGARQKQHFECLGLSSADSQQQPGDIATILSEAGQQQHLDFSSTDSQQQPGGVAVVLSEVVTHVDGLVLEQALVDDNVGRDVEVAPTDSNVSHKVLIAPAGTSVNEQHLSDVLAVLHEDGEFSMVGHHELVLPLVQDELVLQNRHHMITMSRNGFRNPKVFCVQVNDVNEPKSILEAM
ncbi:hypothetical protein V6N11_001429 [Hibiscus sabdariffa]|uniref:Uncharacterized protein n=2 Tax=Hibiscus sabdariffa TaxID=183260 RepID=A0ABR1ZVI6_9ROSI